MKAIVQDEAACVGRVRIWTCEGERATLYACPPTTR